MRVFDDKASEAKNISGRLVFNSPINADDAAFRATYVITADLICSGKITALFDLFVIGDVTANEIDVKGKFVCLGKCKVSDTLVAQNDIIASIIEAQEIICHENITAREIDANKITCDGKLVVEKTLAIEGLAKCNQTVICGETAYGSGRIVANTVITGEPIDLDDGEESVVSPYVYKHENDEDDTTNIISFLSKKYCESGDYHSFLTSVEESGDEILKNKAEIFHATLIRAEEIYAEGIEEFRDTKLLLQLLDTTTSGWFEGWHIIDEYKSKMLCHFDALASGNNPYLPTPKPATDLHTGDYVRHSSFGDGYIKNRKDSQADAIVDVDFGELGIKKFTIPASLKFFKTIGSIKNTGEEATRASLVCNVDNYREWIDCLRILYDNSSSISPELHGCIYELLMSNLGLKSKFVLERFQEKGWKINGK